MRARCCSLINAATFESCIRSTFRAGATRYDVARRKDRVMEQFQVASVQTTLRCCGLESSEDWLNHFSGNFTIVEVSDCYFYVSISLKGALFSFSKLLITFSVLSHI